MSRSLAVPWIIDYLLSIAEEHGGSLLSVTPHQSKYVQVIKFLTYGESADGTQFIWCIVSDGSWKILARLSKETAMEYEQSSGKRLTSLRTLLGTIMHFKPMFMCAPLGDKRGNTKEKQLCLDVQGLKPKGSFGEAEFHNPKDVSTHEKIAAWIKDMREGHGGNILKRQFHLSKRNPTYVGSPRQTKLMVQAIKAEPSIVQTSHYTKSPEELYNKLVAAGRLDGPLLADSKAWPSSFPCPKQSSGRPPTTDVEERPRKRQRRGNTPDALDLDHLSSPVSKYSPTKYSPPRSPSRASTPATDVLTDWETTPSPSRRRADLQPEERFEGKISSYEVPQAQSSSLPTHRILDEDHGSTDQENQGSYPARSSQSSAAPLGSSNTIHNFSRVEESPIQIKQSKSWAGYSSLKISPPEIVRKVPKPGPVQPPGPVPVICAPPSETSGSQSQSQPKSNLSQTMEANSHEMSSPQPRSQPKSELESQEDALDPLQLSDRRKELLPVNLELRLQSKLQRIPDDRVSPSCPEDGLQPSDVQKENLRASTSREGYRSSVLRSSPEVETSCTDKTASDGIQLHEKGENPGVRLVAGPRDQADRGQMMVEEHSLEVASASRSQVEASREECSGQAAETSADKMDDLFSVIDGSNKGAKPEKQQQLEGRGGPSMESDRLSTMKRKRDEEDEDGGGRRKHKVSPRGKPGNEALGETSKKMEADLQPWTVEELLRCIRELRR